MAVKLLDKVINEIDELWENEQEYLLWYLVHHKGRKKVKEEDRPNWMSIAGTGERLLENDDAQEWVKRGRLESDAKRNIEGLLKK